MNLASNEKQFMNHRSKLLRGLEEMERRKRQQFEGVMRELKRFKQKETNLRKYESNVSSHLTQINRRIEMLKRLDEYDKRRIRELTEDIKRMKKEMPWAERDAKTLNPRKHALERHERAFSQKLNAVSSRVHGLEVKRSEIQRELDSLYKRESLLKNQKMYWSRPAKHEHRHKHGLFHTEPQHKVRYDFQKTRKEQKKGFHLFGQRARVKARAKVRVVPRAEIRVQARRPQRKQQRNRNQRNLLERIMFSEKKRR